MDKLFDKEDILTSLTTDKAKIGDNGYFGDTLKDIETSVERGEVYPLVWIDRKNLSVYPFKNNFFEDHFALFLPADKAKKEPTYRPFNCLDELFDFFVPNFDEEYFGLGDDDPSEFDTYKKTELLLGLTITLKKKEDNFVRVITINEIGFCGNDDDNDIYLNFSLVKDLFHYYEILIDGEWVPFGVKE